MKLSNEYGAMQNVYNYLFNLNDAINIFNEEYKRVCKYRYGLLEDVKEDEIESFEVLLILDKLGYPLYEMGTYLFKDMIIEIGNLIDSWNENERENKYEELVEQLGDKSSKFYTRISSERLGISQFQFDKIILYACKLIDYERMNKELANEIFDGKFEAKKYQSMSIYIANYFREKRKIENNKYK